MRASKIVLKILHFTFSLLILVLILFLFVKAGTAAYQTGYRVFTEPAMEAKPGRDMSVQIGSDMSVFEIGTLLEEKGLVKSGFLFTIQLKTSAYADSLKPGIYTLNTSLTAREMMQIMAKDTEETSKEAGE